MLASIVRMKLLLPGIVRSSFSLSSLAKPFADRFPARRYVHTFRLALLALITFTIYIIAAQSTTSKVSWLPQAVHDHLPFGDRNSSAKDGKSREYAGDRPFLAHHVGTGVSYSFKGALKDIIDMTPDEIYIRDLLGPITGGGEERLKEVGVRARAYSRFFNVWEALHVVTDGTLTYVRDDVVQYLETVSTTDLEVISDMQRGDIIRAYESYRHFLTLLSGHLFPWTAPYFSDHMTLHAHFYHGGRGIVLSGNDKQAVGTSITREQDSRLMHKNSHIS